MGVYLREKKLGGGQVSFYLDIYHNKRRWYEFLEIKINKKNPTPQDKEKKRLATEIRSKRENELIVQDNGLVDKGKRKANFVVWFHAYMNGRNLDLWQKVKSDHQKEKVSILDDVDFELELIVRDEINVAYIIQLLIKLKSQTQKDTSKAEKEIFNLLNTETTLRSKRELIEKFIAENLPVIDVPDDISQAFDKFWSEERKKEFEKIVKEEYLSAGRTEKLIEDYLFSEREPRIDEVLELVEGEEPSLQCKPLGKRILKGIVDFVETFINGMNLN